MRFVSQLMRVPVGAHSQSEAPAGRHAEAMGDGKDRHLHGDISMRGEGLVPPTTGEGLDEDLGWGDVGMDPQSSTALWHIGASWCLASWGDFSFQAAPKRGIRSQVRWLTQ